MTTERLMMNVPAITEWSCLPGYEETLCACVTVAKRRVEDCSACKGTGIVGMVPIGVWDVHHRILPALRGDPRFDPRVQ